jgi:hypothetical protein
MDPYRRTVELVGAHRNSRLPGSATRDGIPARKRGEHAHHQEFATPPRRSTSSVLVVFVGIAAASTEFTDFDGVSALVVERDRLRRSDGAVLRLHQEDLCQALSVPDRKYATDVPSGHPDRWTARPRGHPARRRPVHRHRDCAVPLGAPDHAKNYWSSSRCRGHTRPDLRRCQRLPHDPPRVRTPPGWRCRSAAAPPGEVTLHHVAVRAQRRNRPRTAHRALGNTPHCPMPWTGRPRCHRHSAGPLRSPCCRSRCNALPSTARPPGRSPKPPAAN